MGKNSKVTKPIANNNKKDLINQPKLRDFLDKKKYKKKTKRKMQASNLASNSSSSDTNDDKNDVAVKKSKLKSLFSFLSSSSSSSSSSTKQKNSNSNKQLRCHYLHNELKDTIEYRKDPKLNFENNLALKDNLLFFRNIIKNKASSDGGHYLNEFHTQWFGEYDRLESAHDYIQWLFPIQLQGMNFDSQPLQYHELQELKHDPAAIDSLIKSFELMLDFYGTKLVRKSSSLQFIRIDNYKQRYTNLLKRSHNLLRITRILKCLGYFDLEAYQIGWLSYLIDEILVKKELAKLETSLTKFWVHTIRDDEKRREIIEKIESLIDEDEA